MLTTIAVLPLPISQRRRSARNQRSLGFGVNSPQYVTYTGNAPGPVSAAPRLNSTLPSVAACTNRHKCRLAAARPPVLP